MSLAVGINLDLVKNELQNARVHNLASAPASPLAGQEYFDTTMGKLRYYDGAGWITVDASAGSDAATLDGEEGTYYLSRTNHTGTQAAATISDFNTAVRTNRLDQMAAPTAAVAMNSQQITGLADPTSDQHAATQAYVLAQITALIGGAPGALDTLNELAAAINDDASYAATVTSALGSLDTRLDAVEANAPGLTHKYATDIGDGSTVEFTITHNLGTRDVTVQVRQTASPYGYVLADVEAATTNTVVVRFSTTSTPTTNQYRVVVVG